MCGMWEMLRGWGPDVTGGVHCTVNSELKSNGVGVEGRYS